MNTVRALLNLLLCLVLALAWVPAAQACTEAGEPGPAVQQTLAAGPQIGHHTARDTAHGAAQAATRPCADDPTGCDHRASCCADACASACAAGNAASASVRGLPAPAGTLPAAPQDLARPGRTEAPETPPPIA